MKKSNNKSNIDVESDKQNNNTIEKNIDKLEETEKNNTNEIEKKSQKKYKKDANNVNIDNGTNKEENESDEKIEKKPKKNKLKKFLKIILIIFIILLILLIIFAGVAYFYLKSKLDKINYVDLSPSEISINEGVEESLATYRNIVILGIDARSDTFSNGNRSDCIMILSLNESTNKVKIASVYRDTYVNIEGYGLDKITHAYSYGGAQLALSTINENLDLNITEFVAINFDSVRVAVDCVGGVEITLDSDEVKYINSYISGLNEQFGTNSAEITKAGTYNLDGVQALAYARIRYTSGGDYKRTERMRDVFTAVFNKVKKMDISTINSLLDEILPHVSTNISQDEIISMIPTLASIEIVDSLGWPYEVKGITLDRWYGVPVDLVTNVSKLHEELFDEEDYEPTEKVQSISESIVNKTGYSK